MFKLNAMKTGANNSRLNSMPDKPTLLTSNEKSIKKYWEPGSSLTPIQATRALICKSRAKKSERKAAKDKKPQNNLPAAIPASLKLSSIITPGQISTR